jgi:hypothetical protein
MKKKIEKFEKYQLKKQELKEVKGGHPASPYICANFGYEPGTGAFANCLSDMDAMFMGIQVAFIY